MAAVALIWLASARDLQWRARRVVVAVVGAGLVFAITLLLSGFRSTYDFEADRLIHDFGAAGYVVPAAAEGPFSAGGILPSTAGDALVAGGQAGRADPVITGRRPVTAPRRVNAYVIGHRLGGLGAPHVTEGRAAQSATEAVVDASSGFRVGDVIDFGAGPLDVVGRVRGRTIYFGIPLVYVSIEAAQRAIFGGQALATSILTDRLVAPPPGLRSMDVGAARRDLTGILGAAVQAVSILRLFLWCVAGAIIASVLYVTMLERARDFAVFRAIGLRAWHLAIAVAGQAVTLALAAAVMAGAIALVARPVFPVPIILETTMVAQLPVAAVLVGLAAALVALRRSFRVDPASAFQGP